MICTARCRGCHEQDVVSLYGQTVLTGNLTHNALAAVANYGITELFSRYKSNATTGVALLIVLFIDDADLFGRNPFPLAEQLADLLAGLNDVHAALVIQ